MVLTKSKKATARKRRTQKAQVVEKDTPKDMFKRLGPEIRLRILKLLLQHDEIYLQFSHVQAYDAQGIAMMPNQSSAIVKGRYSAEILRVSKTMHIEGSPVLYRGNTFHVACLFLVPVLERFLRPINDWKRSLISDVNYHVKHQFWEDEAVFELQTAIPTSLAVAAPKLEKFTLTLQRCQQISGRCKINGKCEELSGLCAALAFDQSLVDFRRSMKVLLVNAWENASKLEEFVVRDLDDGRSVVSITSKGQRLSKDEKEFDGAQALRLIRDDRIVDIS